MASHPRRWRQLWQERDSAAADTALAGILRGQARVTVVVVGMWTIALLINVVAESAAQRVLVGLVSAAAVVSWLRLPRRPVALTVVPLVGAAVSLATTDATAPGLPPATFWFEVAALAVGLGSLTFRGAVAGSGALVVAALAGWSTIALREPGLPGGWRTVVAWTVTPGCVAVMVAAAAALVRMAGRSVDTMAASAASALDQDDVSSAARAEFFRATRLLHDTVINTLSAISRGIPPDRVPALRERCQQDLAMVRQGSLTRRPADPLDMLRQRATALGLRLTVRGDAGLLAQESDDVLEVALAALGEGLVNISKHAGVQHAELVVSSGTGTGTVLRLVDQGRGFSGPLPEDGGVEGSILRRCAVVGIQASVVATPGAGTTVTLELPGGCDAPRGATVFTADAQWIALLIAAAMAVLVVVRTALAWSVSPDSSALLLAAGLVIGAQASLLLGGRRGLPPAWSWLVLPVLLGPLLMLLAPRIPGTLTWWAVPGALGPIVIAVLLDTPVPWLVTIAASGVTAQVVAGDQDSWGATVPQALSIALGTVLLIEVRRRIYQMLDHYDALADERDRARRRSLGARLRDQRTLDTLTQAVDIAITPLVEIAEGRRTGAEPGMRLAAGNLAAYLRNVSRLDPAMGDLSVWLGELLEEVRRRGGGAALTVDPRVPPPPPAARAAMHALLQRAAGQCRIGETITITVSLTAAAGFLTIVTRRPVLHTDDDVRFVPQVVQVERADAESQSWLQLSWLAPAAAVSGRAAGHVAGDR